MVSWNASHVSRFQSTPPRGGRHTRTPSETWTRCFNPRPRVGGDVIIRQSERPQTVSIHAPAWGATKPLQNFPSPLMFQSTPPRGGRPIIPFKMADPTEFQSTPPRGGRQGLRVERYRPGVSIHAPAWGATNDGVGHFSDNCVSIHAPAWGATNVRVRVLEGHSVSIHAPAWGATMQVSLAGTGLTFQSTPPRGGRQGLRVERYRPGVSIHAPAWGATALTHRIHPRRIVSIHAPAWGATRRLVLAAVECAVSIHAPAWGATGKRTV